MNVITYWKRPKLHRCCYFEPLFYPAVMMFEEAHMPLILWRQKTIYSTFTSYLTEMHANRCFARQVKRPSSLPTDPNQTDIIKWRTNEKLEDIAFDMGIIPHNNALGRNATTATSCGQNSADIPKGLGSQDSWGGVNSTYGEPRNNKAVHLNIRKSCGLTEQSVNVVLSVPSGTVGLSLNLTRQRSTDMWI
jgi:hypothetical protein